MRQASLPKHEVELVISSIIDIIYNVDNIILIDIDNIIDIDLPLINFNEVILYEQAQSSV